MSQLRGAHAGYSYQDLMCAGRLVDLVLGTVAEVTIDRKLVTDDRLDDLTAVWVNGLAERVQFKHSVDPAPLALATFTTDVRDLKLSAVIASAVAYRDQADPRKQDHLFRIVMRAARPVDSRLTTVLVDASPDPGPFLPGMATHRFRFDPDAIWPDPLPVATAPTPPSTDPWTFLRVSVRREDLVWFAEHALVEVAAPAASFNLAAPGDAEQVVLQRATEEIGAGIYPNAHRSSADIIGAFLGAAQSARGVGAQPIVGELLSRAQIAEDFGAVARGHVRQSAVEVARPSVADELAAAASSGLTESQPVVITGAPGSGKSWASEVLVDRLRDEGWLVGEHSCFLGASDLDRDDRVRAEVVFASLAATLLQSEPELESDHRPRFASDERALAALVRKAITINPDRPVALVIDGLDHVSRVLGSGPGGRDPSTSLAQDLALLELPTGAVMVVFSQPGRHLEPLSDARILELPTWQHDEVETLAARLQVIENPDSPRDAGGERVLVTEDATVRAALLDELTARSGGNPLYATYLCRELLRSPAAHADPVDALATFPAFDGTLRAYYAHLVAALASADAIAEILAVLDFAVTRPELREIYPEMGHRVDAALEVLSPVIVEVAGQGGVRIFHESFSRFLLNRFEADPRALEARLGQPISWLDARGLFDDTRAFRFLLPMLARAGRDREVVDRIDSAFARRAIRSSFSATAVGANLVTGAESAARLGDWPALVRCVELARAAYTFESERLDSTLADHADVPIALIGPGVFAERLLFDGRTTMPSRAGLLLCLAVDRAGGTAPWVPYLKAYERESATDRTSYGEGSDRAVLLASLHGQLRLSSVQAGDPDYESLVDRLTRWLDGAGLRADEVVATVIATLGAAAVPDVARGMSGEMRGAFALAVANASREPDVAREVGGLEAWVAECVEHGIPLGSVYRLLDLGTDVATLPPVAREAVLVLTRNLQTERSPVHADVARWLDGVEILANLDQVGLSAIEGVTHGPGWFACWLRFAVKIARLRAERRHGERGGSYLEALRVLAEDTDPFSGTPRACDLFQVERLIADNIALAIAQVTEAEWEPALEVLSRVSDGTTTSLAGSEGGPLTREVLLDLVYRFTSPERSSASRAMVDETIKSHGTYRFYYAIATHALIAARLALIDGAVDVAQAHWDRAVTFLLGYGWRKDITIFDLLDSLPTILALDASGGRARLARLQPLVERVINHTDGSETRHALPQWWELLATTDPDAAGWTLLRDLTRRPNVPQSLLEGARSDLWKAHQSEADPVVAAALRITLSNTAMSEDRALLARLEPFVATSDRIRKMCEWIAARWDERASRDGSIDATQRVEDDGDVGELNRILARLGGHPVTTRSPMTPESGTESHPWMPPLAESLSGQVLIEFRPGALGVARGIREWSRKTYGLSGPRWDVERLVNAVGYRLLELAAAGQEDEATASLHAVADALRFGDENRILASIADGLEIHGLLGLATDAHVLTFTRSRGGGGWLTFGGPEHVPSLERALALDPERARQMLALEIGQVVRGPGYRTLGVSRALAQAFGLLAERLEASEWHPTALSVWDAACEVIESRLPAADAGDAPREVYLPQDPEHPAAGDEPKDPSSQFARAPSSVGTDVKPGDALVAATVAGLAHPAREQKRRTLLAIAVLLDRYPDTVLAALDRALPQLDIPTTTWVLHVLSDNGLATAEVGKLHAALLELAASNHLSVRAVARRLLQAAGVDPGPIPPGARIPDLVDGPRKAGASPEVASPAGFAEALVEASCGHRLERVESELPELRPKVSRRVAERLRSETVRDLLAVQRRRLVSAAEPRIPDAITGDVEAAEEALQYVGGGLRNSLAVGGLIMSDPDLWDAQLAAALTDVPYFALALEASRVARPAMSDTPISEGDGWTELKVVGAESHVVAGQRILVHGDAQTGPPDVLAGPYAGWKALALTEEREGIHRHGEQVPRVGIRTGGYEVRSGQGGPPDAVPPLGYGDGAIYRVPIHPQVDTPDLSLTQPVIGEDHGERRRGSLVDDLLGLPAPLLAPAPGFVVALGLKPSTELYDLSLFDDLGRALVLRTWRAGYGSGEYELARPSIRGCDVLLRADVFERLQAVSGPLVWREHTAVIDRSG